MESYGKCSNCQFVFRYMDDESRIKYCPKCGSLMLYECPRCQARFTSWIKVGDFCTNCGVNIFNRVLEDSHFPPEGDTENAVPSL